MAALREHGLMDRAMISTMEVSSIHRLRELAPELRRGWTFPKVSRDWRKRPLGRAFAAVALAGLRRRAPAIAARGIERLQPAAMWVYHPVITARLAAVTRQSGVELIAWTVDDLATMRRLVDARRRRDLLQRPAAVRRAGLENRRRPVPAPGTQQRHL